MSTNVVRTRILRRDDSRQWSPVYAPTEDVSESIETRDVSFTLTGCWDRGSTPRQGFPATPPVDPQ